MSSSGTAPTVRTVLDVSTVHVPFEARYGLEELWGNLRVSEHEYGYIVFLPDNLDERAMEGPEWLRPILIAAKQENAMLIVFDRDADQVEGWSVFE